MRFKNYYIQSERIVKMRMWIILFVILILSTLAGLAYLTSRVAKFDILIKLTHENQK